jgi:hypothetical protein
MIEGINIAPSAQSQNWRGGMKELADRWRILLSPFPVPTSGMTDAHALYIFHSTRPVIFESQPLAMC